MLGQLVIENNMADNQGPNLIGEIDMCEGAIVICCWRGRFEGKDYFFSC